MPSKVTFVWRGDELVDRLERAAREAADETVDAARDDAALSHEWMNRTMQLQEEIVSVHADEADPNPTASFGTTRRRGFVGLFHEIGTVHEHERPFLRPAGDRNFPSFGSRIRRRFAGS